MELSLLNATWLQKPFSMTDLVRLVGRHCSEQRLGA
jgi:hypothetical protein